ncbi:type II toxin-antitoxin system HipA family toxin [bacterium]|nr:MAG: type II toxin-antitoxin system HipA family toxin [bacterium]
MNPTSNLKEVEQADVYKGDDLAGELIRTQGAIEFRYHSHYVQSERPPIASSLPLSQLPVRVVGTELPSYFANLLPEGVRLLGLKDRNHTSLDDHFTLLLAVGGDTIGDTRIVPKGQDPNLVEDRSEPDFDTENLFARARAGEDPAALSGVQEKVSSRMLSLPRLTREGPAIFKLGPPELPFLVENEAFFMTMAGACGVPVVKVRIESDAQGGKGLLVRRFDRRRKEGRWIGIAQEDGCQLTNSYPGAKYRIPWRDIATIYRDHSAAPLVALQRLLAQIAFSWIVGNGDLHAKNVSLQRTEIGWMPTPAYDIISTLPFRHLEQRAALKLDGRDNHLKRVHLLTFFGRFGVPEKAVNRTLDRLMDASLPWIERLEEIGYDEKTTERMRREIGSRREGMG